MYFEGTKMFSDAYLYNRWDILGCDFPCYNLSVTIECCQQLLYDTFFFIPMY